MPQAVINAAASGANEIIPAVAGKKIIVQGYLLVAAGAVTATWKSATTALSGAMSLITGTPVPAPIGGDRMEVVPWLETASGEALNLTLGGAVQVSGHITYQYASA